MSHDVIRAQASGSLSWLLVRMHAIITGIHKYMYNNTNSWVHITMGLTIGSRMRGTHTDKFVIHAVQYMQCYIYICGIATDSS